MRIVLTYDVSHGHTAIKSHCAQYGFLTSLNVSGVWRKLPNTTLVGDFRDADAAIARFHTLMAQAAPDATLRSVFATLCDTPTLYTDDVVSRVETHS